MKLFLALAQVFVTKIVRYDFEITEKLIYPDGTEWKGAVINNQLPGPEIRVKPNDILIVNLRNNLPRNFTLHFHGLDQFGSNDADGVPFVSQYPIPPNGTYLHKINIGSQSGTYWYHGHVMLDAITAFGPLIVEDNDLSEVFSHNKKYQYDNEHTISLSGLYHKTMEEMAEGLTNVPFNFTDEMRSVLINGKSFYGNSNKKADIEEKKSEFTSLVVEKNKRYRIRFIGSTLGTSMRCEILRHKMTIIEIDGVLVNPIVSDMIVVHSGQRYSVIVEFNKARGDYFSRCSPIGKTDPENGYFIISYKKKRTEKSVQFIDEGNITKSSDFNSINDKLKFSNYYETLPEFESGKHRAYALPEKVDRRFIFDVKFAVIEEANKVTVNDVVYGEREALLPTADLEKHTGENVVKSGHEFVSLKYPTINRLKDKDYRKIPGVYQYNEGETVELVIQTYPLAPGLCAGHPFHLHGHIFYVISDGIGKYNESKVIRRKNLYMRDTDYLNEGSDAEDSGYCGYKVIRFIANNPGAWIMHCHITNHMAIGMQFVFMEKPKGINKSN